MAASNEASEGGNAGLEPDDAGRRHQSRRADPKWLGRHRGDHELHEYVEPIGADRGRACSRKKRPSAGSRRSRG